MSTVITFAANNDLFRKRKRVYRACESCKKRRKRCVHTFSDQEDHPRLNGGPPTQPAGVHADDKLSSQQALGTPSHSNPQSSNNTEDERDLDDPRRTGGNVTEQSVPVAPPKFVGFLSPEAIVSTGRSSFQHQCGCWISPGGPSGQENQIQGDVLDRGEGDTSGTSVADRALHAYLEAVGVSLLPPRPQQEALLKIYFSFVHPILPLLDEASFDARYVEDTAPRILVQAMCIVAAKHDQARPYLRLGEENIILEPREFVKRLHTSVTAALGAKLEKDRITLIQVLALISLHFEGSDGAEQASLHLSQAIHHAHTIGLHLGPSKKDASNAFWEDLFWCLWSLDKLFGSMNGRPLLMHDRDNWIYRPTDPERKRTAFAIWLKLSEVMDRVTCLYRPTAVEPRPTGWEEAFPSFDEIINGGERLDGPIIAVLELYYHTVAMASHNAGSINMPVRPTNSYSRQSLSALKVMSIIGSDCPKDLPPLPIVPYSLSLAMSVAYRQFRQSKLQMHRNRAKEDIKTCCKLLNKLRTAWWSAGAMADLGRAALAKADRANRTADSRQSRTQRSMNLDQPSTDQDHAPRIQPETDRRGVPTQQQDASRRSSLTDILNTDVLPVASSEDPLNLTTPGQAITTDLTFLESPDWMNFDAAFENMDTLLGSSGADLSMELFKPFNYEGVDFWDPATT